MTDTTCSFSCGWRGLCGLPAQAVYCKTHEAAVCSSCGKSATRECVESGSFICGAPLCSKCQHKPDVLVGFSFGNDGKHGYRSTSKEDV